MPEGDTVWRTASELRRALGGQVLTGCDVRVPAFATVDLTGTRVDEVVSRGKHLFVRVGTLSIHSHLKMEGSWQVYPLGARWRRPAHTARTILSTERLTVVGFSLGLLEVIPRARDLAAVADLGPDLLGTDWDSGRACAHLARDPDRPIADALLDQRNLAGIGNVYRNELCYVRGIHPTATVGQVGDLARLVELAHRMLELNKDRAVRVTTGDERRGHNLWVYGRTRQPCRRCGTTIRRQGGSAQERVTYWCPRCQPEIYAA